MTTPKSPYAKLIILLIPAALLLAYWGAGLSARHVGLELPLWLKICCSVYIAMTLHVVTMGLLGTLLLKVPIERMSFGFGGRGLKINVATIPISFEMLFFGGSVKFVDNDPQLYGWRRCVIELSGCAVLLALAAVIMKRDASFDVLALWRQLIEGALSPFARAQVLLMDLERYLGGLDELSILAAMSSGMAAINLLPLPLLNGGNALMYFVSSTLYPLTRHSQERLFRVGFLIFVSGFCSWLVASLFLAYKSW